MNIFESTFEKHKKLMLERLLGEDTAKEKYSMMYDGEYLSDAAIKKIFARIKFYHKDKFEELPAKDLKKYTGNKEYQNILINHFNNTFSDKERSQFIKDIEYAREQEEIAKDPEKLKQRKIAGILDNFPQLSKEDILDKDGNINPDAESQQYNFYKLARQRWLEKANLNEWNKLTIVHWVRGEKMVDSLTTIINSSPIKNEISATYYPPNFDMSQVGRNRWGDIGIQVVGEVISGFSMDGQTDNAFVDGKHATPSDSPTAPNREKFGGRAYTLKPVFETAGHNELLIKNAKPVKVYFYKKNSSGAAFSEEDIGKMKKLEEFLKQKNIPYEWIE